MTFLPFEHIMTRNRLIWILLALPALFFSCQKDNLQEDAETPRLEVKNIVFSKDYRTFELYLSLLNHEGIERFASIDSIEIVEYNRFGALVSDRLEARVTGFRNVGAQVIDSLGIKVLVMVDLTLPQKLVDEQLTNVKRIRKKFSPENVYVTFLHSDGVSQSFEATDYIMSAYFVSESDDLTEKRLYRAVNDKISELSDTTTYLGSLEHTALIVFSDGNIYKNDAMPMDPDHYRLQTEILRKLDSKNAPPVYYFNIDNSAQGAVNDAANFMQIVADKSLGGYGETFDLVKCEERLLDRFHLDFNDCIWTLENPSGRLFDGATYLKAYYNDEDEHTLLIDTRYYIGTACKPVIIDGKTQAQIVLQGLLCALMLVLLIYLTCQFTVPTISYRRFYKRYVTTYHGPNTTLNGMQVADTCYFCKAPFHNGNTIVAKCEHTMHLSCWNENHYHCPEYGTKCKTGSHYYNPVNQFDPRNASFYMGWLIVSVIMAVLSWLGFTVFNQEKSFNFMIGIYSAIKGIPEGTPQMTQMVQDFSERLNQFPSFGAFLGFVLAFFVTLMATPYNTILNKLKDAALKAFVSGLCGYIFFMLGFIVNVALDSDYASLLVDWLPWTATASFSVFLATYHTLYKPRPKWLVGFLTVGVFSMFLWDLLFAATSSDYRLLLFLSNLVFVLGITLSIASPEHRSHRYVLHVSGSVKEMDIALYKWFIRSDNAHVTIGRSVDCSICTSWDLKGNVAAVHAEIVQYGGKPALVPLEDGIRSGKKILVVGKHYDLYHGRKFTIGTTTFTLHQRDLH